MRHAKVTPEGKYIPPSAENAKATYGTMVTIRALLVNEAGWVLARATTIAVRHSRTNRTLETTCLKTVAGSIISKYNETTSKVHDPGTMESPRNGIALAGLRRSTPPSTLR